ncbi:Neurochondrin-domain-containing protein [Amylocarpus encephaloides]|uniref:Neurochondrin-domain-containing protein n=1 Tax=Amylocarpus encephaloides TaxID=45428 RepID=A0A9P8C836_9HELO|nr:Neurochondrin-domain-containing protein [Amylocarpus encephaloides]
MAESISPEIAGAAVDAGSSPLDDPAATFARLHALLKAKNDTSRFVGLALLKTVLDNGQLVKDPARLHILWEALSPRFLDRLLRARENDKISKDQAKDMVDLAVAILHTFTKLLPDNVRGDRRLTARIVPIIQCLLHSSPDTIELALKTLITIISHPLGASEFIQIEDLSPLTEIASQYALVLDVFSYAWLIASSPATEAAKVRASIDKNIPILIVVFKQTDAVTLIESIGSFLPKLDPEALSQEPVWLVALVSMLRKLVVKRPTATGRVAYTKLAAALLQAYPAQGPILLFKNNITDLADSKPFSYLLINLLLIDLKSTFPSLLAQLNNASYSSTSSRLAAAFDILSSFIGFLVRSLDSEDTVPAFSMPPDLLLKLRKDIAETISLAIEYLRDRWDASIAGASGLHESARSGTATTSEGTRFTLTWESTQDNVTADPLILAGIRAMSIWVREDENENLRNESAGLMDMFVELYKNEDASSLDFRYPILLALEVIMLSDDGVERFLEQGGWQVLSKDLQSIFVSLSSSNTPTKFLSGEVSRGLEIIRVLIAVLDDPRTHYIHENWMACISVTASMNISTSSNMDIIELQIAALQLSTALLSKAASGMQKRNLISIPALVGLAKQLRAALKTVSKREAAELKDLLDDVSLELENLRGIR